MHFVKYHGLENEFLIAIVAKTPEKPSELAKQLCDTETGLGADGLIFGVEHVDESIDSQMILFNADGSRAEISGNGIRCLAHEIFSSGNVPNSLDILTDAGIRQAVLVDKADEIALIQVNMGFVKFGPEVKFADLEVQSDFAITKAGTVDVGNPHIVLQVSDLDPVNIADFGSRIEAAWGSGVNVHVMEINTRNRISFLTWERGVGVTAACGSGAIASASIAYHWGLIDREIVVAMAGGEGHVSIKNNGIFLTGESVRVSSHEVPTSG